MSVVYAMYDALVSINVPDEKAKAVIDAMEREMMDKLATKSDLAHVKELLSKDIETLGLATKADLNNLRDSVSRDIQIATREMSIKLGTISALSAGVLFTLLKLTA